MPKGLIDKGCFVKHPDAYAFIRMNRGCMTYKSEKVEENGRARCPTYEKSVTQINVGRTPRHEGQPCSKVLFDKRSL